MGPETVTPRDEHEEPAQASAAQNVLGSGLLFASAGWAHDIGNSLQAAALQAEVLQLVLDNAASNHRATGAVTALQDQLERIHRLVSAWVELSVPGTSGDLPFDLRGLLDDLELLVAVTLRHRGFTFELSYSDTALWVSGDRCALLHASLGLVAHLIDSTSGGGRLTIRPAFVDDRTLQCSVALIRGDDNADSISTTSPGEVIGNQRAAELGLEVGFAQRTIAQHHGLLEWRDLAHAGREFRFELPLNGGAGDTGSSASL
jgi:hypothetical protein